MIDELGFILCFFFNSDNILQVFASNYYRAFHELY